MHATHLLATAMGYPVNIPKAPITRSIRMMFKEKIAIEPHLEKRKFVPIKYRAAPQKDELSFSEREILNLMNTNKEMTGVIAATMTDWTRNHCSMILTSLWKKGLLARRKEKGNHTRWYVYSKKEGV